MRETNENERREYFRIEDDVHLNFNIISEKEYQAAPGLLADLHNSSFCLSADFATLNNKIHPVFNNINQTHPEIAQYLEFLNQKIDNLSQILLCKETDCDENKPIKANISASGIMFESKQVAETGQLMRLELILLPERVGILIFGRVVSVNSTKDGQQKCISVEFEHIRFEDQELMIKHNLNKQMADLRDKNDND